MIRETSKNIELVGEKLIDYIQVSLCVCNIDILYWDHS